jgi:ribosomal protein S25
MDREAQRDLEVLEAVAQNERITQRSLASRLGIVLSLATST